MDGLSRMSSTKYIVYDSGVDAEMIIFGDSLQHVDVAHQMKITDSIISAGFLLIRLNKKTEVSVDAYGKSMSLDVPSIPEFDTKLAKKVLAI